MGWRVLKRALAWSARSVSGGEEGEGRLSTDDGFLEELLHLHGVELGGEDHCI